MSAKRAGQGRTNSFTTKWPNRVRTLESQINVSEAFDPAPLIAQGEVEEFPHETYTAVWDTGATSSVITEKVIGDLELQPVGLTTNHTVGGTVKSERYLVNFWLPNKVIVPGLSACRGEIYGTDVLIGMDVIGRGDFAVTNSDGQTWLSFTMPSVRKLDFVAEGLTTKRWRSKSGPPKKRDRRRRT